MPKLKQAAVCKIPLIRMAAATLIAFGGAVSANTVSLSNVSAQWFDGVPPANVSYFNNPSTSPSARWGVGTGEQSGFDFTLASQPINFNLAALPTSIQAIGLFSHLNFPINDTTEASSVKLRITADISVDGIPMGNRMFDYGFQIYETDNALDPCPNGDPVNVGVNINGCADSVQVTSLLPTSETFVVGSDQYTLDLLGFSLNAASLVPIGTLWTAENQSNRAFLLADVRRIPEPGSLALLGLGLLGLCAARRTLVTRAGQAPERPIA